VLTLALYTASPLISIIRKKLLKYSVRRRIFLKLLTKRVINVKTKYIQEVIAKKAKKAFKICKITFTNALIIVSSLRLLF